jgi:hypothetical protein
VKVLGGPVLAGGIYLIGNVAGWWSDDDDGTEIEVPADPDSL